MKKTFTIAAAALMFAACTKEAANQGTSLTAYTDDAVKTHLSIESGAGKVYWDANDAINVFSLSEGAYISSKFTTSQTGTSVKFNGGSVTLDENCYALYPYDETAVYSAQGGFASTISSIEQAVVDDSFTQAVNLAVGRCNSSKEVAFKNVGGLLSFTLTQERADTIKFIEIKANNGETIAVNGAVSVDWNGGEPTLTPAPGATLSDVITIRPKGETFQKGETYFVWLIPGNFSKGITLTLVSPTNMKATKAGVSALNLGRNKMISLGDIGGLTFKGSEAEKITLTFDFSTCPEGWPCGKEAYSSKEPGEKDFPYSLDGTSYVFSTGVVTDVSTTRSVCWGYNGTAECEMLIIQNERFLGLPAIEGWKLNQLKFAQALATNSGRKMIITDKITEKGKQAESAIAGGEAQAVGTNGTEYSFYLSATKPNTRYYMAPTSKGTGLTSLTLVYEKAE